MTPTPTDARECRTYTLVGGGFGNTFNWTNCDGTAGTTYLGFNQSTNICAKQGSVSQTGGPPGSITDIGTCPLPSPTPTPTNTSTPTNTPSATPTITPTNTGTPTNTPTNTLTPTPTPSGAAGGYKLQAENADFLQAENGDDINIEH